MRARRATTDFRARRGAPARGPRSAAILAAAGNRGWGERGNSRVTSKAGPLQPGTVARNDGDAAKALSGATRTIDAAYEFPYLAHAAMEPMNCVMRLADDNSVEVWNGEQMQTGDQMTIAKTLGQALEKCAEPFDVLLSDLSLPDGSGHELMRRLSSSRPDPPPAIALSGRGSENDVQASLQAGFRSHLVKPVHFHNLVEEIERVRAVSTAG